jgi:hypothetical protein
MAYDIEHTSNQVMLPVLPRVLELFENKVRIKSRGIETLLGKYRVA